MSDLFFFSPFVNILFLVCIPLLEGRTMKDAFRNMMAEIIPVQRAALKFWLVAHAVNYTMVLSNRAPYTPTSALWPIRLCNETRHNAMTRLLG